MGGKTSKHWKMPITSIHLPFPTPRSPQKNKKAFKALNILFFFSFHSVIEPRTIHLSIAGAIRSNSWLCTLDCPTHRRRYKIKSILPFRQASPRWRNITLLVSIQRQSGYSLFLTFLFFFILFYKKQMLGRAKYNKI